MKLPPQNLLHHIFFCLNHVNLLCNETYKVMKKKENKDR